MTAGAEADIFAAASQLVADLVRQAGRAIVGIAGPPGAGKSTLASALTRSFSTKIGFGGAVTVPMDGYHLSNPELDRLGLADRKGAPETFDAAGFVHLLARIRAGEELVYAPAYSRLLHESISGAIPVSPRDRLVLVEGNYLLLPDQPWVRARPLFDVIIYLDGTAFAAWTRHRRGTGRCAAMRPTPGWSRRPGGTRTRCSAGPSRMFPDRMSSTPAIPLSSIKAFARVVPACRAPNALINAVGGWAGHQAVSASALAVTLPLGRARLRDH